jgi:hypothetical protein
MNLIKCENGHYYNADKLEACPHCANENAHIAVDDITGIKQTAIDTYIPKQTLRETYRQAERRPIAGWLVCICGHMKGDSFTLFTGKNYIGRDTNMDVILFEEPTVSRWNHAVITYHDDDARFTLSNPSDTQAQVLCNGQPVAKGQSIPLSHHDRITLGECTLAFVPFCGAQFQWEQA